MSEVYLNISTRVYRWLLFAYPWHFRRRFSDEMLQTFRDCYRFESNKPRFLLRTLVDLVSTAARERTDGSGEEGVFMNDTRRDLMAILTCVGIIAVATLTHRYIVRNNVRPILLLGYILDAVIVAGVMGNLLFFILAKATKFNRLRLAFGTFVVVHTALLLLAIVIGQNHPGHNIGAVTVSYVVSLLFWTGLHWTWLKTTAQKAPAT